MIAEITGDNFEYGQIGSVQILYITPVESKLLNSI